MLFRQNSFVRDYLERMPVARKPTPGPELPSLSVGGRESHSCKYRGREAEGILAGRGKGLRNGPQPSFRAERADRERSLEGRFNQMWSGELLFDEPAANSRRASSGVLDRTNGTSPAPRRNSRIQPQYLEPQIGELSVPARLQEGHTPGHLR